MHKPHLQLLLLVLTLAGCAVPQPVQVDDTPVYKIPDHIWRQVEQEIINASITAAAQAAGYARKEIKNWEDLIWRQTEAEFIPWYADYWTQQWLFLKMAWYQLQAEDEEDYAGERMRAYLTQQLQERVLQPVSEVTDPAQITEQAASLYLESLRGTAALIQDRYLIPPEAWRIRLDRVPVIEMATDPVANNSLYQLLQPGDPRKLPFYTAMVEQSRLAVEAVSSSHPGSKFEHVVDRAVHTLEEQAALKGGVAAAATMAGGGIGFLISAGVTAWGINEHNTIKPALEAELRSSVKSVLEHTTRRLIEDRWHGVLSLVQHMHSQLEEQLWNPLPPPVSIPRTYYPVEDYPDFDSLF